jgi:hypothetical protein
MTVRYRVRVYGRSMGRHGSDPAERRRYVITAIVVLLVIVLLLTGASVLRSLAGS